MKRFFGVEVLKIAAGGCCYGEKMVTIMTAGSKIASEEEGMVTMVLSGVVPRQ
jgi:hypothetical protein